MQLMLPHCMQLCAAVAFDYILAVTMPRYKQHLTRYWHLRLLTRSGTHHVILPACGSSCLLACIIESIHHAAILACYSCTPTRSSPHFPPSSQTIPVITSILAPPSPTTLLSSTVALYPRINKPQPNHKPKGAGGTTIRDSDR